ncbi:MAG TPA: sigma-70 family RNA polymerase sigma factor [Polyangia bacterium]|nr:sigma-70 family RNA polymerase sigma factor [Polyangia bacterium]
MAVKRDNSTMFGVSVIEGLTATQGDGARADETALVEAVRRGDAGSREALYHRYKRRVFALAVRIVGASDAEEVSQEAFIRIFRGLPKFRGDAALGTWIYRLAVNAALSHRARRPAVLPEPAVESAAESPSSFAPEPRDLALRRHLEQALTALPVGYRTVIVLHDIEGLEHEEVASILGCHPGTSKSQLHKARAKLREALAARGITADELLGAP